ncbi:ATP-binding cassette domain-containing protein [Roseibacillus persicicus]|uniref:ATP-binding cassette domain-containing protein n=1 Tax=Roseibacillus persicicus TaxID=454148 RepID=UPI00280F72A5|nr:ATP-binding cassette domain-containing protein [Roseibacillus persicicus]MDQ8189398.1 ATP-binding cassette domain-containing protein [Roseibacillus persicicus]
MLQLDNLSFHIAKGGEDFPLLDEVSLDIPTGHFMAIVGPSGCGKTTLLKTIAGINPETSGSLRYQGRDLAEEADFEPHEIGYVPQFSVAYDELTVDESVEAAARLRIKSRTTAELDERLDRILAETGMTEIADRPVKVLSGGQKRRLGLAMELVSSPKLLLCDEVTSGLDPRSEREIVHLLHDLSRKEDRIIISVTHSLAHLELYDSLLVLHEGRVAYHGPPSGVTHYFSVKDTEEIYPALSQQPSAKWQSSWNKHRKHYEDKLIANSANNPTPQAEEAGEDESTEPQVRAPGFFAQTATLLSRRARIFFRDKGQIILQLALIIGFPLLVSLFSPKANEQSQKLSDSMADNKIVELINRAEVRESRLKVGSANSGIIMFQVVLLCLMGSNNAAREVASERNIFEKEKFGGLSSLSYLTSKLLFLSVLVLVQSLWMGFFVEIFWKFTGNFASHLAFLVMANAAMTAVCLGISSLAKNAEQASLLSIYLVGFQLPLSGAVLALPEAFEPLTRPFIAAYWAWSGAVDSLDEEKFNAIKAVTETSLSQSDTCIFMLLVHLVIGLAAALIGMQKPRWD